MSYWEIYLFIYNFFVVVINQNAPVLAGVPKGLDWAICPPPAAPQDGGGLDPGCSNEMTKKRRDV